MGGSSYRYDPATLINTSVGMNEPILFVSLNYRVGLLGFANGVQAEKAGATNLGLLDQEMAVQWVIKNIKAFGGDPSRVTLSGQSAGSVATSWHVLANRLPIAGAILESGTANTCVLSNTIHFIRRTDSCKLQVGCSHSKRPTKRL